MKTPPAKPPLPAPISFLSIQTEANRWRNRKAFGRWSIPLVFLVSALLVSRMISIADPTWKIVSSVACAILVCLIFFLVRRQMITPSKLRSYQKKLVLHYITRVEQYRTDMAQEMREAQRRELSHAIKNAHQIIRNIEGRHPRILPPSVTGGEELCYDLGNTFKQGKYVSTDK